MLRTLQTKALSKKIATLFDNLAEATNLQAKPIPAMAGNPRDDRSNSLYLCELPPRRRRTRRHRLPAAPGTVRTAWY